MVGLPRVTPVTSPVVGFTVATAGVPLIHIPPWSPFVLSVMCPPTHTVFGPLIVCPVTIPRVGTGIEAIAGDPLTHVPPGWPFVLRKIEDPAHTDDGPLIVPALARGFTVMVYWDVEVVHALVTCL